MANQFILVGRLLEIKDNSIIINTTTDKIIVKVPSSLFEKIQKYYTIGGVISVMGKITTTNNQIELTCERCAFLSTTAPTE